MKSCLVTLCIDSARKLHPGTGRMQAVPSVDNWNLFLSLPDWKWWKTICIYSRSVGLQGLNARALLILFVNSMAMCWTTDATASVTLVGSLCARIKYHRMLWWMVSGWVQFPKNLPVLGLQKSYSSPVQGPTVALCEWHHLVWGKWLHMSSCLIRLCQRCTTVFLPLWRILMMCWRYCLLVPVSPQKKNFSDHSCLLGGIMLHTLWNGWS